MILVRRIALLSCFLSITAFLTTYASFLIQASVLIQEASSHLLIFYVIFTIQSILFIVHHISKGDQRTVLKLKLGLLKIPIIFRLKDFSQ